MVEDDLSLISGLSFAVKKAGYGLNIAHTKSEADEKWEDGKYDLVILDVSLPDGSGYITKPFKLAVFMSRINALLRRSDNFKQTDTELSSGGISIQLLKSEVYKDNEKIELTANEYKLLHLLMENPGQVLSPEQILGKLWDCNGDYVDGNTLSVYIRRLRTKIEDDPGKPERIVTVRRMGYKWNAEK